MEIEFEGTTLVCEKIEWDLDEYGLGFFKNLAPGDIYIGKRNQGWKMGTVSERLWEATKANGWIFGNENIYPYNVGECLKVLEIK